jgi:type IV pilus assembly protein PilW
VQYGVSATPNSNLVTAWVNANAANADGINWGAPTLTNRNRIKALRIAVVARNAKLDPDVVTTACSSIIGAAPTGLCAWEGSNASPAPVINLNDPLDLTQSWAHYRYKVFETIIPLRNVIWSKSTL